MPILGFYMYIRWLSMSKEGRFMIFCIEIYRSAKNLKGKEVMQLFEKYNVCEYIMSCYGALHTTGKNYIINDIDLYIEARQAAEKKIIFLSLT